MSAALPRSRATARPWGRRTCPPRCRGRAPPIPLGTAKNKADEHVRRAAEVERHRGPPPVERSRRTCPPRCRGRAPPRDLGADEHVRRSAVIAHHRVGFQRPCPPRCRGRVSPRGSRMSRATADRGADDMSAALPRSSVTAGAVGPTICPPRCRGRATARPWGRRTCPPRCRCRASPRGHRGARSTAVAPDEHVRRTARSSVTAVRRVAPLRGSRPTNMSAALPRTAEVAPSRGRGADEHAPPWDRQTCPPRCRGWRATAGSPQGSRSTNMSALPPRTAWPCSPASRAAVARDLGSAADNFAGLTAPRCAGRRTCPAG